MASTLTRCIEEETSFCISHLWRRRHGWRPQFIYARGPGGIPALVTPLLSLLGVWRFSRPPRRLADEKPDDWREAVVTEASCCLGSYGMGGPGFAGIRLRRPDGGSAWFVFTVWAADGWLTLDEALLSEGYFPDEQAAMANPEDGAKRRFRPLQDLVGLKVHDLWIDRDRAELAFVQGAQSLTLRLQRDSSHLPVHRGSREPKVIADSEDIRDAVIVSSRANLWV